MGTRPRAYGVATAAAEFARTAAGRRDRPMTRRAGVALGLLLLAGGAACTSPAGHAAPANRSASAAASPSVSSPTGSAGSSAATSLVPPPSSPSPASATPAAATPATPPTATAATPTPTHTPLATPHATSTPKAAPTSTPTSTPPSTSPFRSAAPASGQPLAGKVVVLDPGHNLNNSASINQTVYAGNGVYKACDTTGTSTNGGYPEHAFTWDVANRVAPILRAEGATVILTRSSDTGIGPCITTRAQIGNDAHADAFIAIHADGGPAGGHGFFVMQPPPNNPNVNPGAAPRSRVLARDVHDVFHTTTGIPYSTYIAGGYYPDSTTTGTINLSHGPVITIECLNMRNAGDAAIATSAPWRQTIARGIAAGLTAFLSQ
jgi:N-acetylmuramoyl-L-alanine amidase